MGSAAKSTSAQPSTNIPIQCPECGTKPMAQFFWKYKGMLAHWKRAHSTETMPAELSEQL
jgi:sarcosine oxidase delta subunit